MTVKILAVSKMGQLHSLDDEKYKIVSSLLDGEEYILVHLNTATQGLVIPDYLKSDPTVTLRLSRNFAGKMTATKELITADLLFKGEYHTCTIPWSALWGVSTAKGLGRIWTECIPAGVVNPGPKEHSTKSAEQGPPPTPAKGRPTLKRIK